MARITIPVVPEHPDSSECTHPQAPTGLPRNPKACPGRPGYRPHCSECGPVGERQSIRSNADDMALLHRQQHATRPAHASV
jgi:hypothetical protein